MHALTAECPRSVFLYLQIFTVGDDTLHRHLPPTLGGISCRRFPWCRLTSRPFAYPTLRVALGLTWRLFFTVSSKLKKKI